MLRNDGRVGEALKRWRVLALHHEVHLAGHGFLDRREHTPVAEDIERRVLLHQLEGEDHVAGGHRFAVGPAHALADRKTHTKRGFDPLEAGRKHRHELAGHRVVDRQRFVHRTLRRPALVADLEKRVEGAREGGGLFALGDPQNARFVHHRVLRATL